jgi:hypothetical protein
VVSVANSQGLTETKSVSFDITYDSKYSYEPSLPLIGGNYIEIPSSPELQLEKFSVASWFKTGKDDGATIYIVNKGGGGKETAGSNQNYGIWMNRDEKIVGGFESSDSVNHFATSPSRYNDSKWHYAVAIYDGARTFLYVDGVQVGTVPAKQPPDITTNPLRVGANSEPLNGFFIGNVDEIRVWNRPLTADEVFNQYNNSIFDTNGQILYLPLDNSSNAILPQYGGPASYGIKTSFSNGDVTGFRIEPNSTSIALQLNTRGAIGEGKLTITLPRSLIDAKVGTSDTEFMVMASDNVIEYQELNSSEIERILEVTVPDGVTEVTIIGTKLLPEFPTSILAMTAGILGTLLLIHRRVGK